MPIQIIWGNDLNAQNTFIQTLIDQNVSKEWKEINVTHLNGEDEEQIKKALEEILTPPLGDGSRVIILKNNPIFTNKNEELIMKFEKIYSNIPDNTFFVLQSIKKPDSRLKSTKFIKKLINTNLASEKSFSLPEIWDYEGQQKFLINTAKAMNIKLDQEVAQIIIDSVGNDSFKLKNELIKAKTYLSALDKNQESQLFLKSEDVKKIFNDHQSNIFKIIDFLLQKKINESLYEIKHLLEKGEPPIRLNAGLISQIRIYTVVKLSILSEEKNKEQICQLAGISNPKRIFFIIKKVNSTSKEYLINLMSSLLNIESLLKKGNNPINVFTESLINLV